MADLPPGAPAGSTTSSSPLVPDPQVSDAPVTRAPAPTWQRGTRARAGLRRSAMVSLQLLLVAAALVVLWQVLGTFWVVLLPVIMAVLVTTVLWPLTRFLRRHRWPPALAAATTVVGFLALLAGIIAWLAPQVVNQVGDLTSKVSGGLDEVQGWLEGPPFNLGEDQLSGYIDTAINKLQENATSIANYAATGATAIGNTLLNVLLALLLVFFFLKDGPRFVPWLAAQTGPRAAPHVAALSERTWKTLSEFIRQQALVGMVDAVFIGIGLWVLDVTLVIPLAVITFFAAFIPIVGAVAAGAFAVLIALVDQDFQTAVIVLVIVLVVQQLEGNVLQPIIQGRGLNLHSAVVILAVTAGSSLYGITGAFLAVPVAALAAVFYRYARDVLDGTEPEVSGTGTRSQLSDDPADGAPDGGAVLTEGSDQPAGAGRGTPRR